MTVRNLRIALLSCLAVPVLAGPAAAGGFYLKEQSVTGVGRALAGETAIGADASTVYANPAAMTRLGSATMTVGAYGLFVTAQQENQGTTRGVPGLPVTVPVAGGDGGSPFSQPVMLGNAYAAAPVNDRLWVGVGINVPFGLEVSYDDDFFGRYDSLRSDVTTINIQPSVAYRINDTVSVGGGINLQYVGVRLSNALPNLAPTAPDGLLYVSGDDWSHGWNIGVHVDLGQLELGAHYRSQVEHDVTGSLTIDGLLGPLAAQNRTVTAEAPLTLPDIATAGAVFHLPGDRMRVMADVSWYDWSDFERIAIHAGDGASFVSEQNYKDSWSAALGGEYDVDSSLTLRGGVQHDRTPTRDGFRTTRVPDGDRWWLAAGASYRMSRQVEIALSYAHIFVSEETIDRSDPFYAGTPAEIGTRTRSTSTGNADVVALGITARF